MMKKILLSLLLFLCISAYSQTSKIYIDLSSGVSLPISKFASYDLTEGSFARTGGNLLVNFNWLAKPPFGIRISIAGSIHPVDVSSLGWKKVAADPFMSDVSIRSDPYLSLTAMGGVFYDIKIIKRLRLQIGANAGIIDSRSPYQLYKPNNSQVFL